MTAEQGKPMTESRGETEGANSFIRWFAEEGKRIYGDIILAPTKTSRYVVLKQPDWRMRSDYPLEFPSRHDYPQSCSAQLLAAA